MRLAANIQQISRIENAMQLIRISKEIRDKQFRSGALFVFVFIAIFMAGVVVAQTVVTNGTDSIPDVDYPDNQETVALDSTNIALPLLTTADEVLRLSPAEAQRGNPVNLRGVVTCVVQEHNAFIVQDETHAVFVVNASPEPLPQMGELLQMEGKADKGSFAPLVRMSRYTDLGAGRLPEPIQPTRDQLMNGSLDDQLVEVHGIVEQAVLRPAGYGTNWSRIILRTTEGPLWIDVWLVGTNFADLTHYEDAIVRLRGCLFVALTVDTHQLDEGHVRMYVNSIDVDQPAPADEFSAQPRRAADLTLFNPEASVFQRVKVSGQIEYMIGQDYFLMDGTDGLRFTLRAPAKLHTGDVVDVVGYPELNGAAPHLRSAVARVVSGHVKLAKPRDLSPDDLPNAMYDSTRVRIEGLLVSLRATPTNETFEIQSGSWRFIARVKQVKLAPPPIGSRLALIGVYAAQGGSPVLDNNVAPFDLLVHSDADVTVLSKPSWWTLPRLLVIVGALACALALLGLWVTQLHRQVEDRTAELEVQIQERQRLEHQRAMEQERARIAQDLHDELGSGITEISMLVTVAGSASGPDNGREFGWRLATGRGRWSPRWTRSSGP
jgi:hypothetical protein